MLCIERDQSGAIVAIRRVEGRPGLEPASLLDEEVLGFLRDTGELENLTHLLTLTDTAIVRVLEDLIDLLIEKKLILFTELPPPAQEKIQERKLLRSRIGSASLMVDDIL
ncbi:hypothetical protein [Desulfobulbus alkaliphilus]|uniref:hypothetical protein n=1 Tax=Desulfobulbus alkaliphilus TaxID=869814 RepID=UPI001965D263|nr:hypothetical protein [Desulfobulbus alkaliphilus]MBM9538130.1 hypothetical protein [Desulfobulbus alkaliphilus]